jgi:hypothetical protein
MRTRRDAPALILDLETTSIDGVETFIEPIQPPSNYRAPETIARYVQEKTVEKIAGAALDIDLARIVCAAWMLENIDIEPHVVVCPDEHTERCVIEELWQLIALPANATRTIIGYNIFSFDLPLLMRRSVYIGSWPMRYLSVDKYRSGHVDLYQRLSFNGAVRAHSLAFYAKRFGLALPELEGAAIPQLVAANDWDAIRRHAASDVVATYQLAERLGYINEREDDCDEDPEVVGW